MHQIPDQSGSAIIMPNPRNERLTERIKHKLKKRTLTSGCAQGTAFGDLMEALEGIELPEAELRTSWLYQMTRTINTIPSLYLEAGAIHGCVLCRQGEPICYMEDVGRHNAVDKLAGWMYRHRVEPADKILYTTGRLTSEMTIKTVRMGSDPGLALGLHGLGRFTALSGEDRIVFDQDVATVEEESAPHARKGADNED